MRIISQDGKLNLCLDRIHIATQATTKCWIINARDRMRDRPVELAAYSSQSKCENVFRDIITACSKDFNVIHLPPDNEVLS